MLENCRVSIPNLDRLIEVVQCSTGFLLKGLGKCDIERYETQQSSCKLEYLALDH